VPVAAWINPLSPRRYASQTSRWKANEVHPRLLNQDSTAWIGVGRRVREGFGLIAIFGTMLLTLIVSRGRGRQILSAKCEMSVHDNLKRGVPIMARINVAAEIDWTQCELIEQVPGKVSGRPIVRGTRILPDAIINSYDAGGTLDDIHEDYPGLSIPQIQRLIEFAHTRRAQPTP
jgi:uncharacterized protein (DUF433 family)